MQFLLDSGFFLSLLSLLPGSFRSRGPGVRSVALALTAPELGEDLHYPPSGFQSSCAQRDLKQLRKWEEKEEMLLLLVSSLPGAQLFSLQGI